MAQATAISPMVGGSANLARSSASSERLITAKYLAIASRFCNSNGRRPS